MIDMNNLLNQCFNASVTMNPKFPVAAKMGGHLKRDATFTEITGKEWKIVLDGDIDAKYVHYLEFGTYPHLIPNAFGRGITVLHPGSMKHKGFIERGMVDICLETIIKATNGKRIIVL